ncbi:helix-turn-helix domain-containing protein [Streptomyces lasiicapitis]|uniref:helix-turn-helix domain-containing protein n=1 Tax=Streptomyces lasiicapitis TaxID=1923961 RepID=UPI00365D3AD5
MLTLGTLIGKAELELAFAAGVAASSYKAVRVSGLTTLSLDQLLEGQPQRRLQPGCLVLVTGMPFRLRGRTEVALETLMEQMSLDECSGLVVSPAPGAHQPFPQAIRDLSKTVAVPLLVTTAPLAEWARTHRRLEKDQLVLAERHSNQLSSLIDKLPAQLADPEALQRITEWLAQALQVQVIVSEPERTLAASPTSAAESLAPAMIRRSLTGGTIAQPSGPHTQLISLAPAGGAGTVLAVARSEPPFDDADVQLLGQAAKLLGLLDQARREHYAAPDASHAARSAAVELLLEAEIDKARRVMASQAPGLLEPDTVRAFVIETTAAHRDSTVHQCSVALAGRALAVADPREDRRTLIIQPMQPGQTNDGVADELRHLMPALGTDASLGGSGVYTMIMLADALQEASTAQQFALHQPEAIVLSAQSTDLISLLPRSDAQRWAHCILDPLRHDTRWQQLHTTLPSALAYPYTVAARRLHLHRNTVMRRVAYASSLLGMDLTTVTDRTAVGLALELLIERDLDERPTAPGSLQPPKLRSLLSSPEVMAWADSLLHAGRTDRRDLLATATEWLNHDARTEPTARALGLSEVTVRSHLRALEEYTARDFSSLCGLRDLQFSLHVLTGKVDITDLRGTSHRRRDPQTSATATRTTG